MREDENSHKGIDRNTQINRSIINSNNYRRKFDKATDNADVNKSLYDCAKEILDLRSGTRYESMRWIDGETGIIIAEFDRMGNDPDLTGKEHELKSEYGANVLHKLIGHNNIVVIHNHPNSSAPSSNDFNSAYNHGYKTGFVVTHDGRLYKYTSNQNVSNVLYDMYCQRFQRNGCDFIDAQILAIDKLAENMDITFTEVL